MSKKKKRKVPKSGAVWKMSATEATLAKKPHYNGYACGHGVHGDVKYNRTKQKAQTRRILDEQGASRGSLPFEKGYKLALLVVAHAWR